MTARSPTLETMIRAAREAAVGLLEDFADRGRLEVREKGPSDFVTSADLRSQEVLRRVLSNAHPDHALLLEEQKDTADSAGQRARFIVDPLDGTTNFLRGLPHFAVAIAHEVDGEVVEGVVLDVPKGELFWAARGGGAWLGEQRLAVAPGKELRGAVIATGIPHRGRGPHEAYLAALRNVIAEVAGVRRFGSAALDLSYVAAGRFDAFFEIGLAPWDVAAGALFVREAGGKVTRSDGSAMALGARDTLATAGEPLHAQTMQALSALHGVS
jgi:myo-inositol-1(or 4)-monophosphatase